MSRNLSLQSDVSTLGMDWGEGPSPDPSEPQVSLTSVTGESQEPIGKNSKNQIELGKIGGQVSRFC